MAGTWFTLGCVFLVLYFLTDRKWKALQREQEQARNAAQNRNRRC